jgi:hypothetical protein
VKEQPELKVEMVPVDQLTPYYGNAKKHPREQVEQIAKSIQEFGNCDPIAIWTNNKGELEIVEGHGRLYALDKLGVKECPVIFLDHLTDEQRRAYTHVHNQLTMNTGWDFEILEEEFQALPEFDWEDFGFDSSIAEELEEDAEMEREVKAECPFSEYIDEESNYVVLKFNTDKDWLNAQSILGLHKVKALSTRKDGVVKDSFGFTGLGRVVDGVEAIVKIQQAGRDLA